MYPCLVCQKNLLYSFNLFHNNEKMKMKNLASFSERYNLFRFYIWIRRPHRDNVSIHIPSYQIYSQYQAEEDSGEGAEGAHPPYFLQSIVSFANTLRNYKLCYLKLNWSLMCTTFNIRLPKYDRNMFNIQSFVIWQTIIIFF